MAEASLTPWKEFAPDDKIAASISNGSVLVTPDKSMTAGYEGPTVSFVRSAEAMNTADTRQVVTARGAEALKHIGDAIGS